MNLKFFIVIIFILLTLSKVYSIIPLFLGPAIIDAITVISGLVTVGMAGKELIGEMNAPKELATDNTKFNEISDKLASLESKLYAFESNYMKNVLSQDLLKQYDQYEKYLGRIDQLYIERKVWMEKLMKNKTLFIEDETERIVSLLDGYPKTVLTKIHDLFFKMGRTKKLSFLDNYQNSIERDIKTMCDMKLSPHHELFSMYKEIIFNELKSLAVLSFSYLWRIKFIGSNYNEDNQDVNFTMIRRINEYTQLFKKKLKLIPNYIRRCDPPKPIKDNTYAAFDNLVHSFITNVDRFEPKDKKCESLCWQLPKNTSFCEINNNCNCNNCDDWYWNSCQAKITNCIESSSYEFCRRNRKDTTTTRNYHWFKDTSRQLNYGDINKKCDSTEKSLAVKKNPWLPSWAANPTCYSCICQCVDERINTNSKTIRAFSYLWSKTSDDMVATGVRLVAQDRMIHIQLKEGKLLPQGKIDETTERWVPLPTFVYENHFPRKAIYPDGTVILLNKDVDYGLVAFDDTKISLKKLNIKYNYLLSAVRFNKFDFLANCISLETKFVKFDFTSGEISLNDYKLTPTLQELTHLTELILNKPDEPLKFKENVQDSMENQYIKIGVSDLVKDASQTTIPFFDLLSVSATPSAPISAIELFHKGDADGLSGGYISLKIHLIDFSFYIDPE